MPTFQAYLVTPPAETSPFAKGEPREWLTVKAEAERRARELGGTCAAIDVPATKAALIPFLNCLELSLAKPTGLELGLETDAEVAELEAVHAVQAIAAFIAPPLESPPTANDDELGDETVKFDARVLEAQVERLGELGDRGLDELEHIQTFGGVGGSFSRGVHLLSIAAAGEHQLARLFLRQRRGAK